MSEEHGTFSGPDAEELAIGHALDLLPDGVEPEAIDADLAAEYLEVAASLPFEEVAPAPFLEERVMAAAREARRPDVASLDHARGRREQRAATRSTVERTSMRRRLAIVSAAAAIAAVLGLGGALIANRTNDAQHQYISPITNRELAQLHDLTRNPRAKNFDLRTPDGRALGRAVVAPGGPGFIYDLTLPAAPVGHTYWLWLTSPSGPVRVGRLGNTPATAKFNVSGPFSGVFVTSESSNDTPAAPSQPPALSSN